MITQQAEAGSEAEDRGECGHITTGGPTFTPGIHLLTRELGRALYFAPLSQKGFPKPVNAWPFLTRLSIAIVYPMARGEAESLIERLRHMSEEGISSFLNELMANEAWRRRVGRAGERFLANKQSFDRNVETVLDFVNIPSKRDVRELKARLDHLSAQLVNLGMKIDRILAESSPADAESKTALPRTRRRKS